MRRHEDLRQRLEVERSRLKSEIAGVSEQPAEYQPANVSFYGNHLADTATDTFEEEKALALGAHLQGMLAQVEEALDRFDKGTFGICVQCGKPIEPARLKALPYATTCLRCASPEWRARVASA